MRAGFLWPVGDAAALTAALDPPLDLAAAAARQWFEEHWTYAAIGRRALWAYIDILGRLAIMLGLYR